MLCSIVFLFKKNASGLPWQSSSWGSELPLQGRGLIRGRGSCHATHGAAKKKKREKNASLFAARFWSPRWPLLDGIPTPHSKQMFLPSKVEFLQASLKAHVSSSFFIFLLTTCLKQNWQKWLFPCKLGWKALESYSVTVARVLSFSKLFPPILWNINTYWQFKVAMRLKEIISIELIA